ncbi:MucBP domain-containing protein [Enterococcus sp. CSURQ0835]|uniref:MucBP domain-containing protein n=1 Tax=Enterococcus sp. CSURQ0835 TaxID=2681394 RepID=UPI00135B016A|nr:MucBP domain-containing protein [Enterococcus sp. CSURQ0835]
MKYKRSFCILLSALLTTTPFVTSVHQVAQAASPTNVSTSKNAIATDKTTAISTSKEATATSKPVANEVSSSESATETTATSTVNQAEVTATTTTSQASDTSDTDAAKSDRYTLKSDELGALAEQQAWNNFTYTTKIKINQTAGLKFAFDIQDENDQNIYVNILNEKDTADSTIFISNEYGTLAGKDNTYQESRKTIKLRDNDVINFEVEYRNAKLWFRYWNENEKRPDLATGGAVLDVEHFKPAKVNVVSDHEKDISLLDSASGLTYQKAGKEINYKSQQQYFSEQPTVGEELNYEKVKTLLPSIKLQADPKYENLYNNAWRILFDYNIVNPKKDSPYNTYVGSGFDSKNIIWQWDSCFAVLFSMYGNKAFDPMLTFDNFYMSQIGTGQIYRAYYSSDGKPHGWAAEPGDVNPPLYGYVELQNYKLTGNVERLKKIAPVLQEYADWISIKKWSQNSSHKLFWNNGNGNGMDNLPTQPGQGGNGTGTGQVDMSSQLSMLYDSLAKINTIIGNADDATRDQNLATDIKDRINKYMWNDDDNRYYELEADGTQYKVDSLAGFWTLITEVATPDRANKLKEALFNKDMYWTDMPFPTLAKSDQRYSNKGYYWKGGVWAPTVYMAIEGLKKNGFDDEASRATQKYLDGLAEVYDYTGTFWETYAPEKQLGSYINHSFTGRKEGNHNQVTKKTLDDAAKYISPATDEAGDELNEAGGSDNIVKDNFVGWTGIGPLTLSLEHIVGINSDLPNNKINWNLKRTDENGINNLSLGANGVLSVIADKAQADAKGRSVHVTSDLKKELSLAVTFNNKVYPVAIPAGHYENKVWIGERDQAENVTVQYVDEHNKKIHASQTISGKVGDAYDATTDKYKLAIDGYTLDESKLPENGKGELTAKKQVVKYVYTKNPVAKNITVKYVDEHNKKIHASQTISGKIGEAYDATTDKYKLAIDGYTLDESKLPENGKGELTAKKQVVKYVYTKNSVAKNVTVQYVDEHNKKIHASQMISGKIGEAYDATTDKYKLAIDGYTLDESKLPENGKGELTAEKQVVKYVYTKNPVADTPNNQTSSSGNSNSNGNSGSNANSSSSSNGSSVTNSSGKVLPNTGDEIVKWLPYAGVVIILTVVGIYRFRRKKNGRN